MKMKVLQTESLKTENNVKAVLDTLFIIYSMSSY